MERISANRGSPVCDLTIEESEQLSWVLPIIVRGASLSRNHNSFSARLLNSSEKKAIIWVISRHWYFGILNNWRQKSGIFRKMCGHSHIDRKTLLKDRCGSISVFSIHFKWFNFTSNFRPWLFDWNVCRWGIRICSSESILWYISHKYIYAATRKFNLFYRGQFRY